MPYHPLKYKGTRQIEFIKKKPINLMFLNYPTVDPEIFREWAILKKIALLKTITNGFNRWNLRKIFLNVQFVVHQNTKIKIELVFIDKKCIFAPLINRGRVPQNLIIRLCQ